MFIIKSAIDQFNTRYEFNIKGKRVLLGINYESKFNRNWKTHLVINKYENQAKLFLVLNPQCITRV